MPNMPKDKKQRAVSSLFRGLPLTQPVFRSQDVSQHRLVSLVQRLSGGAEKQAESVRRGRMESTGNEGLDRRVIVFVCKLVSVGEA